MLHVGVGLGAVLQEDVGVRPPQIARPEVGVLAAPPVLHLLAVGEAVEPVAHGEPVDERPDHLASHLGHPVEDEALLVGRGRVVERTRRVAQVAPHRDVSVQSVSRGGDDGHKDGHVGGS